MNKKDEGKKKKRITTTTTIKIRRGKGKGKGKEKINLPGCLMDLLVLVLPPLPSPPFKYNLTIFLLFFLSSKLFQRERGP